MERRHLSFIAISLAIVLAGQALQAWFFPPVPKPPVEIADADSVAALDAEKADRPAESAAASPAADGDAAVAVDAQRARRTLGSLDPADPAKMLVTLTSRGAAVERIELADERFHDQDDRSGYLGHLACATVPEGCRIGVVGPSSE